MKSFKILMTLSLFALLFVGCEDEIVNRMSDDYPQDYDIEYGIRQVLQYDPVNIKGIDVAGKLSFFNDIRFSLHYNDGKITHFTYSNGDAPFSPFDFEIAEGVKIECEMNYDIMPNELRIKGTNNVVAYFQNGEFTMPFQLDCGSISYRYTFKSVTDNSK